MAVPPPFAQQGHKRVKRVKVFDKWYGILQAVHVSASPRSRCTTLWKTIDADLPETDNKDRQVGHDVSVDALQSHPITMFESKELLSILVDSIKSK